MPRAALWARLQQLGIHGQFLEAVKACYRKVLLVPKVNGKKGRAFNCRQGVKQGCPLSPTLFGFFIETLASYLERYDAYRLHDLGAGLVRLDGGQRSVQTPPVPGQGAAAPQLQSLSEWVRALLFADDINLLAHTPARMESMLIALEEFCSAFGMRVNISKTELLVFHSSAQPSHAAQPVRFKGETLAVTARARYLGLYYGPRTKDARGRWVSHAFVDTEERLGKGQRATHKLHAMLNAFGPHSPALAMMLWESLVRSSFSFGAQVWGADCLTVCWDDALKHCMVKEQIAFMRRVVGAALPSHRLLFAELGQLPLQHHWAGLVLRHWNSMSSQPQSLVHTAFCADLKLALQGEGTCWSAKVLHFLSQLQWQHQPEGWANMSLDEHIQHYAKLQLPVDRLLEDYADVLMRPWRTPELAFANPRTFQVEDYDNVPSMVCRYSSYMGAMTSDKHKPLPAPHAHLVTLRSHHTSLMRFRLGVWDLEVNRPHGRERRDRVCRLCEGRDGQRVIEDECHVLLECPAYDALRHASEHACIFENADSMLQTMQTPLQRELAAFVHALRLERTRLLAGDEEEA